MTAEAGTPSDIEDIIEDAADEFDRRLRKDKTQMLQVPQETIEAFINLLFNLGYNLADIPFKDGLEASREWEHDWHHRQGRLQRDPGIKGAPSSAQQASTHAPWLCTLLQGIPSTP